ncbi:ferrous iron transport protein B [Coprothermobacter proteolyticus]|uniref:ferrous iron transport protein B n=1 Tax=Coprothermobacter proteolyticus TaxID=35786 RepID=UPI000D3125D3|nr:ferrous iron transport protein B [Coprothermobacter proteolyticus]
MSMSCHDASGDNTLNVDAKVSSGIKRIVLVGNPNCGKSTLFNLITGMSVHVGNWPGVTVDVKMAQWKVNGEIWEVVDLPGSYSLLGKNADEQVTSNFLLSQEYDVVLNVVDSTSLERSLMLTLELLDLQKPMVVALNFIDELEKSGATIDADKLSEELGIPVVRISALKGINIDGLKQALKNARVPKLVPFNRSLENLIATLQNKDSLGRFEAISTISNEQTDMDEIMGHLDGLHPQEHIAMERYRKAHQIATVVMKKLPEKWKWSDMLDHVLLHPLVGIPTFVIILYLLFKIIFAVGQPLTDLVAEAISWLSAVVTAYLPSGLIKDFIQNALFGGVGNVISFVPLVFVMFFTVGLLENSGYMARASLIMDRPLSRFGLSGKSFISLILGFGCNVPAILSTRAIDDPVERKIASMVIPLIPCNARLPVLTVLGAALFGPRALGAVLFCYVLSVLFSLLLAFAFRSVAFKRMPTFFALEMPPYRMPSLKMTTKLAWFRTKDFLHKAFTVVLLATVVFWILLTFPLGEDLSQSYVARIGMFLSQTVFKPLGFNWQMSSALLMGLAAKEAVLSSLGQLYQASGSALVSTLSGAFSVPSGIAFMVFFVLYVPCIATLAALRKEVGVKWTVVQLLVQLIVAYLVSIGAYYLSYLLFA